MVDNIEGGGKVKERNGNGFIAIHALEEAVGDVNQSCFCTVLSFISGLIWFIQVVFVVMRIQLS